VADTLTIALAQCNPTVGAIADNCALIRRLRAESAEQSADVVVFPELAVTGYPPEDMVLRPAFQRRAMEAVESLAKDTADGGPAIITGGIWVENGKVHNVLFLLEDGVIRAKQSKVHLPNYGVFDEARVFASASHMPQVVELRGVKVGLIICEDTWSSDVAAALKADGAELLISSNASPYETTKADVRRAVVGGRVAETKLPLLYLNIVGGQDEIVFDGGSFVTNANGDEIARMKQHEEDLGIVVWKDGRLDASAIPDRPRQSREESMYQTLVMGLRDYIGKTRLQGAILGLSGGIDSAFVVALAVDALGAENVRGVSLPSRYTSQMSLEDAEESARLLGIKLDTISIEPAVEAYHTMLKDVFAGTETGLAEENIQSRIRGGTLMAISNKHGNALVNTTNKSEVAVGYGTLYGDMCGAYAPLKDVYKLQVYALARWRNVNHRPNFLGPEGRVIPERSITRAPSAELRENQEDRDSLPDYPLLDPILHALVEEKLSVEETVDKGFDRETVEKTNRLLYIAEYKRRQAPPGVKVTSMVFGKDWRYPLAQQFDN
jgi:NAD+ synthase